MLHERIMHTLENQGDLDQLTLARIAGINRSTISRYLNGHIEIDFESVLKIVRYLYPDQEKEIMAEYVLTQENQNARFALEYCVMSHLYETTDQLIEKLLSSTNPLDKEWASMYQLVRIKNNKTTELEDLLQQLDSFTPNSIHMQALKKMNTAYVYNDLADYYSAAVHIKGTEKLIEQIESKFIRDCFNIRLGLIMNNVCLFRNDVEQARYYNSLVMDQEFFDSVKGLAYLHLGYSYMFQDFNHAYRYLNKALDIYTKLKHEARINIVLRNLSFLQSYWKIDFEFTLKLDRPVNISNYVYYLIQKGDKRLAKEYLSKIDVDSIPDGNKGFYYYYQGLINEDKNSFYQSVKWFRECGDYFHVQLPMQAMHHLNQVQKHEVTPQHTIIIELDGQEADLLTRSLYGSIINAAIENKKDKVELYSNIMKKLTDSKQKLHEDWTSYLIKNK